MMGVVKISDAEYPDFVESTGFGDVQGLGGANLGL